MCIRCPCVCPSSRLGELNYYPQNTCEVDTDTKENDRRVPISNMDLIEFLHKDQCSMDPHRITTPDTTQSSDKDTTCQSTMPASRRTQSCSESANQSDRRRRSLRLKKGLYPQISILSPSTGANPRKAVPWTSVNRQNVRDQLIKLPCLVKFNRNKKFAYSDHTYVHVYLRQKSVEESSSIPLY